VGLSADDDYGCLVPREPGVEEPGDNGTEVVGQVSPPPCQTGRSGRRSGCESGRILDHPTTGMWTTCQRRAPPSMTFCGVVTTTIIRQGAGRGPSASPVPAACRGRGSQSLSHDVAQELLQGLAQHQAAPRRRGLLGLDSRPVDTTWIQAHRDDLTIRVGFRRPGGAASGHPRSPNVGVEQADLESGRRMATAGWRSTMTCLRPPEPTAITRVGG
jgi:hypothetical protein